MNNSKGIKSSLQATGEFDRLRVLQDAFNSKEFVESRRKLERAEMFLRGMAVASVLLMIIFAVIVLTASAVQAQSVMVTPYEGKGYAGPIGSDVTTDPLDLSILFEGRDAYGQIVRAVVPVAVDELSLDPAFNYGAFEPNIVNTSYLRPFFASKFIMDLDGDEIMSQITSIDGLPAGAVYHQCQNDGVQVTHSTVTNGLTCLAYATSRVDASEGYSTTVDFFDVSTGTFPANAAGDNCRLRINMTAVGSPLAAAARTVAQVLFNWDAGFNITSAADCSGSTPSVLIETWAGPSLVSFVPESSRHAYIGDVLAATAYNDVVQPLEISAKAAELTAALEDEEGPYFECPDCIFGGAYEDTPLYWREGYSFAPFGNTPGEEGEGGGSGSFECEEGNISLACAEVPEEITDEEAELLIDEVTFDPFEGTVFDDYIADAAFDGFDETRTCPAPSEIQRSGIFGTGTIEIPMEPLCDVMENYINPFLALLAWCAAGLIILRS